jgi:hypothetical protein
MLQLQHIHFITMDLNMIILVFYFALSCFCLGSAWAPCHWVVLGLLLSLLILFIIFYVVDHLQEPGKKQQE